jgi:tetratricopeptide (TPR) repeat protein
MSTALRIFSCLMIAFQPAIAAACINDYDHRTPEPGTPGATAREYSHWLRLPPEKQEDPLPELKARELRAKEGTFRDQSDYAVALLRAGEYKQGRDILQELAIEHGEEYIIAANLGTAYELTGDVPNALKWIRKGHELNPQSHDGTEWLHVKILEAKLQAQGDKGWFAKNSTLGLDFGTEVKPVLPKTTVRDEQQNLLPLDQIRKALEYQLHERTQFIESDDPQMSELFLALGNILLLQDEPLKAYEVFRLASTYAPISSPLLEAKIKAYNPEPASLMDRILRKILVMAVIGVLVGIAIVAVVCYLLSKSRQQKVS